MPWQLAPRWRAPKRARSRTARGPGGADAPARAPTPRRGQIPDEQVHEPVTDLDVDEAPPVWRGQRDVAPAAAGFAVLARAGGEDGALPAVRGDAHHLEPAVLVGDHEQPRAVRQPARPGLPGRVARDEPLAAGGHVEDVDLRGQQVRQSLRCRRRCCGRPATRRSRRRRRRSTSAASVPASEGASPDGRGAGTGASTTQS